MCCGVAGKRLHVSDRQSLFFGQRDRGCACGVGVGMRSGMCMHSCMWSVLLLSVQCCCAVPCCAVLCYRARIQVAHRTPQQQQKQVAPLLLLLLVVRMLRLMS